MRGPQPGALTLNDAERNELEVLIHRHRAPQQLALRGRVNLAAPQLSDGRLLSFTIRSSRCILPAQEFRVM
jgi:hypothetical protein